MTYTNTINYHAIEYLDLFDDLPYKYVKSIVRDGGDYYKLDVEIEDLENTCGIKISFELEIDVSQGSLPMMVTKSFQVIHEYNGSSPMAMFVMGNLWREDDEDPPKCANEGCENCAVKNENYPDSEGGEYWTLCEECFDKDQEEEKPKCKSCCVERVVDYEDNICHTCYHKSCDEGECYCCDNEEEPKEEEKPKIVIIKKKKKKAKKLIIKTCNCITKGGRICCINDFKCSICGVCLYWKGYEEGTTKCGCHHTK